MKIGIFTDSYRPYISGVVRSIDTFGKELKKKGHDIYIFCPAYPGAKKEDKVFRFASFPAPTKKDFSVAIPLSWHVSQTVKRLNLDIIHVHSPFLMGYLGRKCARKHKLPLVFTYHTLYDQYAHYMPFLRGLTSKTVKRWGINFSNKCDLVITPTAVIKEYLQESGVKTAVVNIPTGLEISDFARVDKGWLREKYSIPKRDVVLVYVGRLGKEKSVEFLVNSFSKIAKNVKEASLVLVGSGPEEARLKSLAADFNISSKIVFAGLLAKKEVFDAYAGSDIFVFASLTETQGIVLLEAKASGLPAVAVAAFGVQEMVEHGEDGFLTSDDEDIFTKQLLNLVQDNQLRAKMSQQARINAAQFSTEKTTERLLKAYQELLL